MATQLSAPQIDAQSVIKKMSLSSCRFRLSMRGSSIDEKCEMMDVVGIVGIFMLLPYHRMIHNALFYMDKCGIIEGNIDQENACFV